MTPAGRAGRCRTPAARTGRPRRAWPAARRAARRWSCPHRRRTGSARPGAACGSSRATRSRAGAAGREASSSRFSLTCAGGDAMRQVSRGEPAGPVAADRVDQHDGACRVLARGPCSFRRCPGRPARGRSLPSSAARTRRARRRRSGSACPSGARSMPAAGRRPAPIGHPGQRRVRGHHRAGQDERRRPRRAGRRPRTGAPSRACLCRDSPRARVVVRDGLHAGGRSAR